MNLNVLRAFRSVHLLAGREELVEPLEAVAWELIPELALEALCGKVNPCLIKCHLQPSG